MSEVNRRSDRAEEEIGYGRPPKATRFQKGRSGNPRGRPKGSRREIPYDAVLGQMVLIREGGVERRVTAAEAFLLHLVKRGLDGEGASARQAMAAIEAARDKQLIDETPPITVIIRSFVTPGSVSDAAELLRISRKRDRFRDTAHLVLEPWIVQAALDRLVDRRLTLDQQQFVFKATRSPGNVNWPPWWRVLP